MKINEKKRGKRNEKKKERRNYQRKIQYKKLVRDMIYDNKKHINKVSA